MGRHPKNPSHPLIRLRRILSTPGDEMTRAEFAKMTGIPEPSITCMERGTYKISPKNAVLISLATGVDPKSLIRDDLELLDLEGRPFTKRSKKAHSSHFDKLAPSTSTVFKLLVRATEEKGVARQFHFLFEDWLEENVPLLVGMSKRALKKVGRKSKTD